MIQQFRRTPQVEQFLATERMRARWLPASALPARVAPGAIAFPGVPAGEVLDHSGRVVGAIRYRLAVHSLASCLDVELFECRAVETFWLDALARAQAAALPSHG